MELLIFDDSPSALLDVELKVRHLFPQATVHTALDFTSAIDALDTQTIDLALVDLYMPERNGVDFINDQIRTHRKYAELPVIVVSTIKNDSFIGAALSSNVSDHLHKPVDLTLLKTAIHKALNLN